MSWERTKRTIPLLPTSLPRRIRVAFGRFPVALCRFPYPHQSPPRRQLLSRSHLTPQSPAADHRKKVPTPPATAQTVHPSVPYHFLLSPHPQSVRIVRPGWSAFIYSMEIVYESTASPSPDALCDPRRLRAWDIPVGA